MRLRIWPCGSWLRNAPRWRPIPVPEQLDRRLVVALDGQAEDAGHPASVLELVGDGRELRPEDRQREVLAANVAGAASGCPCGPDRAFEVVDLGCRQLEPPAIRPPPGPGRSRRRGRPVGDGSFPFPVSRTPRAAPCRLWTVSRPDSPRAAARNRERLARWIEKRREIQIPLDRSWTDAMAFPPGHRQPDGPAPEMRAGRFGQ